MKVLFMCLTYMQVIIAIQMKLKLYPNDDVDLILHDHSRNADKIAKNLSEAGLFRRVKFVETKYPSKFDAARQVVAFFIGKRRYSELFWEDDFIYDEVCYFNLNLTVCSALEKIAMNGGSPECVRFEEGLFSYEAMLPVTNKARSMMLLYALESLFMRKHIYEVPHKFICFYPELMRSVIDRLPGKSLTVSEIVELPHLNRDKRFLDILNSVFSYTPSEYTPPPVSIFTLRLQRT